MSWGEEDRLDVDENVDHAGACIKRESAGCDGKSEQTRLHAGNRTRGTAGATLYFAGPRELSTDATAGV